MAKVVHKGSGLGRLVLGVAFGMILLMATARAGWAQAPTPVPPDSGFDVVQVDLEGQLFDRVLPFDVPFILTGRVPTGATTLQMRCWELPPDRAKSSGLPPTAKDAALRADPGADCWPEGTPWRGAIRSTPRRPIPRSACWCRGSTPSSTTSSSSASRRRSRRRKPRLSPSRSRGWSTASCGATRAPRRTCLSAAISRWTRSQAIRAELIQALQEITGADRVPEPGTVFNPDTPFEAVRDEFNRLLRPVRNVQGQIDDAAEDYQDEIANLNPCLAQMRSDPALQQLASALAARAAADPERPGPRGRGGRRAGAGGCAGAAARATGRAPASSRASCQKSAPYYRRRRGEDGASCATCSPTSWSATTARRSLPCSPSWAPAKLSADDLTRLVALGSPLSRWAARAGL